MPEDHGKSMQGENGIVSAGSPHAARAGARVLAEGGNAVDAAIAAALALAVADPINASLFGRTQILGCDAEGCAWAIDGATAAPRKIARSDRARFLRNGFAAVPVPGLLNALAKAHREHGRLPLEHLVAPALALAEDGFVIPTHLGEIWQEKGAPLAADPGARKYFLKPDGLCYGPGETFRQPALARLLQGLQTNLTAVFDDPRERNALASRIAAAGGHVAATDLSDIESLPGEVVRTRFQSCEIVTIGRQGWGHSLVEMLNILEKSGWTPQDPRFTEAMALTILCALHDRPQEIGTLKPKIFGLSFETLADESFARERAACIEGLLAAQALPTDFAASFGARRGSPDRDTSHLSVVDREGGMVALTTSIGPHFGAGVADEVHGCLFAHSYRMASQPTPSARDVTEMTPTIVLRDGRPILSIGAAGSERIPGAVFQVLVNLFVHEMPLAQATDAPRLNWTGGALRVHSDFPEAQLRRLLGRGYEIVRTARDHRQHLGIVQAVMRNEDGGAWGCADPSYDGASIAG